MPIYVLSYDQITGSVAPTRFSMTLVSSTSTLDKGYYRLDPFTGFVEIQKQPHGGIFTEIYDVTAVNGVSQSCSVIRIKVSRAVVKYRD